MDSNYLAGLEGDPPKINQEGSVSEKLIIIHQQIKQRFPFIERISVAIYEEGQDLLKTFISSDDNEAGIEFHQRKLCDSQTLNSIAQSKRSHVINNLGLLGQSHREYASEIIKQGYGSSHTTPFYNNGRFAGMIFVNSSDIDVFDEVVCHELSLFVLIIGLLVCKELDQVKILFGSLMTALEMSHHRDPETGAHLDRMSRYARLIANELASSHQLDDKYIEFIFRFSPLHDVGKIAIPDSILLKNGRLTKEEFDEMKRHTVLGSKMIDRMLRNFHLEKMEHTRMLRNIIEFHHEAVDGSGYPRGLKGDEIPLEARIVAVADIFDALTSERPYKKAWSNNKAMAELKRIAGSKVDGHCVKALEKSMSMVLEIQNQFQEEPLG